MSGYGTDIQLEQKLASNIKSILGNYFFEQDRFADLHHGTDFAIFSSGPVSVAVRLRRADHLLNYGKEFTIRWTRPSGVDTEIDKIRDGYVQYLFYGFVDATETKLTRYILADLNVFRHNEVPPRHVFTNNPPDSSFAIYRIGQFPRAFILHAWPRDGWIDLCYDHDPFDLKR